tara:strand:+ start:157 stop:396 length:240 start_codon:yes stop_codon:yes gene_type:complete
MAHLTVDFRCRKDENRGIYYEETNRCLIFLGSHETLEDLYKTITHEVMHHCFVDDDIPEMDEEQEETLVHFAQWADVAL